MKASSSIAPRALGGILVGVAALAALAGLGFAGWLEGGPRMLMSLAESGLAWCL